MNYSSEWNGDGLIDLVIPVGGGPEVGSLGNSFTKNNNGNHIF